MTPPNPPNGSGTLANWLKRLLAYVVAGEIKPGPGYRVRRTTTGTTLDLDRGSGGGDATSDPRWS